MTRVRNRNPHARRDCRHGPHAERETSAHRCSVDFTSCSPTLISCKCSFARPSQCRFGGTPHGKVNDQTLCKEIVKTDVNFATKGPLDTARCQTPRSLSRGWCAACRPPRGTPCVPCQVPAGTRGLSVLWFCSFPQMASKEAAAAVGALCLLQDREERTADSKALASEHLPHTPCFQKTVDGLCPSLPKNPQLKTIDQHSYGAVEVRLFGGCA